MMADVVPCQTCHGQGVIQKEVRPGIWETRKCPGRCKDGKISKRLI